MTTPNKEDMLRKVRALLAKAEADGTTEAESEALTAKATELMAKYGIDRALAEARANVRATPTNRIFDIQAPYAGAKSYLLHAVAKALHCQSITLQGRGANERVHLFGFESDIELVDMLYTSLSLQMAHATARMNIPSWIAGRAKMAERRSFMYGFVEGVRPRLAAAYALATVAADDAGTTGTELVLASRDVAVNDACRAAYPKVNKVRTSLRGGGYGDGQEAGRRANIHNRPNVGTSRGALSR